MKPAIRVENLGKSYRLAHASAPRVGYKTLRDSLMGMVAAPLRRLRNGGETSGRLEEFWALNDVSFDVQPGEVVGIIGRNGAGKSTLLKILSRITKPSTGRVTINGRVGSLLEVGTGFHPELTGRENVYLNGSILGMSRREISRRFDEIVAFAEVEKFLDTPIKRYSSGMYVRLAFAVSAHLGCEILIVDEVLAVGDTAFQQKCMRKMASLAAGGRTILFVSHDLSAVSQLCKRAVLLERGCVTIDAPLQQALSNYLTAGSSRTSNWRRPAHDAPSGAAHLLEISVVNLARPAHRFTKADDVEVRIALCAAVDLPRTMVAFRLTNQQGVAVFTTSNWDYSGDPSDLQAGRHTFRVRFSAAMLAPGTYSLVVAIMTPNAQLHDSLDGLVIFTVEEIGALSAVFKDNRLGIVTPRLAWEHTAQ